MRWLEHVKTYGMRSPAGGFYPNGGPVTGRVEMTVTFDCRGKTRDEHHVMELAKGSIDGDRLVATAVYVEREGLPKDELSRCKSAYENYQTREDSRRLIGTIDAAGKDEVLVAEVRNDPTIRGGFWVWAVCDNLRRSSALNAVLVAEKVLFGGAAAN